MPFQDFMDNISNSKYMIANQDTMVNTFWECNKKYFNNSLPTPIFETINRMDIIGRFEYQKNKKNSKKPIRNQIIKMSDCFDYTEKDFMETMVHEMIHYYIAWNKIKDNGSHGKEFKKMANEMKEKYDLNITKTIDASSFKLTENAPKNIKKKSFFNFLFG
jgi:hypothetical protein